MTVSPTPRRHAARIVAALPAVVAVAVALAVAAGITTAGVAQSMRGLYLPAPESADPWPAPATPEPSKGVAVVLSDHAGTEVTDFLGPISVLAASDAFTVVSAAVDRRPVSLTGGLVALPDYSLGGLDAALGGRAPDVVVVPALPNLTDERRATLSRWITDAHRRGAVVLSICTGADLVAQAGLLDGRPATTHWADIGRLESRHEQVEWRRGVRFVDDGDVVSSAGLSSGLDATLRVVTRLAGRPAAELAAERVGHSHGLRFVDDPQVEQLTIRPADSVYVAQAVAGLGRPRVSVALTPGVADLSLAATVDALAGSFAADTRPFATDGEPVRSRAGVLLLPRWDADGVGQDARVVVPRTDRDDADPLSAAIAEVRDTAGPGAAAFAGKRLEHRGTPEYTGGWPLRVTTTALLAVVLPALVAGAAAFIAGRALVRRVSNRPLPTATPTTERRP